MTKPAFYIIDPKCGKPAYRVTHRLLPFEMMRGAYFRLLDGAEVPHNQRRVCQSCGNTDLWLNANNIVEAESYDNQKQD